MYSLLCSRRSVYTTPHTRCSRHLQLSYTHSCCVRSRGHEKHLCCAILENTLTRQQMKRCDKAQESRSFFFLADKSWSLHHHGICRDFFAPCILQIPSLQSGMTSEEAWPPPPPPCPPGWRQFTTDVSLFFACQDKVQKWDCHHDATTEEEHFFRPRNVRSTRVTLYSLRDSVTLLESHSRERLE